MEAGIRFAPSGIRLGKQLQPLGEGRTPTHTPKKGNKSPTASKLIVTRREQEFDGHLGTLKGDTALPGMALPSRTTHSSPGGHNAARRDDARVPVRLLAPEEGSEERRWEQHPRRVSCGGRGKEKSRCQEDRGSLSVSSAARERWIYHGFPFLPCFIWQFIILSTGTGQLPRHTPSLAATQTLAGATHEAQIKCPPGPPEGHI